MYYDVGACEYGNLDAAMEWNLKGLLGNLKCRIRNQFAKPPECETTNLAASIAAQQEPQEWFLLIQRQVQGRLQRQETRSCERYHEGRRMFLERLSLGEGFPHLVLPSSLLIL